MLAVTQMRVHVWMLAFVAILTFFHGAEADQNMPLFTWPADCQRGVDCVVQQYPDLVPGPGARDPACAGRTYEDHAGVDIRLISFADLARDVKALSAADGMVLRRRNDASERRFVEGAVVKPTESAPGCGNGLVIDHGNGFETQYCHLKRGGVLVKPGQRVKAGEAVGVIGLSGRTEFPHLEVIFRKDGRVFDPFTGALVGEACNAQTAMSGARSLWRDTSIVYRRAALLDAGFAARKPRYAEAKAGSLSTAPPSRSAPALVGWARILGLAEGDRLRLRLIGPAGREIAANETTLPRNRAIQFLFTGRRTRGLWPEGDYRLEIELVRDGELLLKEARALAL